jgi:competence protein ComEA
MPLVDRVLLAGIAGSLLLAGVAVWLVVAAPASPAAQAPDPFATASVPGASSSATAGEPPAGLVVDVEGAVAEPGIRHLPGGSRIADAIAAAGGYAADADLAASAHGLNLAATLADGDQVFVPRAGETAAGGGTAGGGADGGSGLVNLNTASTDALDALPGIGPATIEKIVAARTEQPFRTLDELVERKVLTASQLAAIRDQITV